MDEKLLKDYNKILIEEDKIEESYNYNLLNNILSLLGRFHYTFSIDAIDIFCRLNWSYRVELLSSINEILYKESKITHENLDKFYINYPNEVNSNDKRELYINSLLYYYFNFWKSSEEEAFIDKPELTEDIGLEELDFVFSQGEVEELFDEENQEYIKEDVEESTIDETIEEIERVLAGGRDMEDDLEDPYSDEDVDEDEESEEDEEDISEEILENQFLNPYEEENEDDEEVESEEVEEEYKKEKIYGKYDKKFNGRYIDELIDSRQYIKLLKVLKKEPNELARRLLFVVEGIYYKYEEKGERLKNLSKTLGIFEGLIDCMSFDVLEDLLDILRQRLSIISDSKLKKIFRDIEDVLEDELEDRKN